MNHISAEASQAFMRKVILPLAGLVVGLMVFAVGGIFWIADYQTDVAIAQQARLAHGALRIHAEKLGISAADYGYWDDAVKAIVDQFDYAWIVDNIGAGGEKSIGAAMSFALDPQGKPVYSRVGGVDGTEDPARFFPQGFKEAHAAWKKLPPDRTYSGIVPYGNAAAIIVIAPVRPWDDAKRPPTGYSLLFVQLLDDNLLGVLSRDYELTNLRIAHSSDDISDPRATVSIKDGMGQVVSQLAWDANRPGDNLLKIALPFLAVFLTTLTALGAFVFRHAIGSAQIINDREKKAFRDPLTNLANRSLFFSDVDKAIHKIKSDEQAVTVMYIDLDGFKNVNDTKGHGAGDVLLQQVAYRLETCLSDGDVAARLGGDEFAVILSPGTGRQALVDTANRILREIAFPFNLPGGLTTISCSIGIATGNDPRENAPALINRADLALYKAKASGKNRMFVHGNDAPQSAKSKVA